AACVDMLNGDHALDQIIAKIRAVLPKKVYDTAYALACDVAVSDGQLSQEELRILEILRHGFDVDRLTAAAIERGAAVPYVRVWGGGHSLTNDLTTNRYPLRFL